MHIDTGAIVLAVQHLSSIFVTWEIFLILYM